MQKTVADPETLFAEILQDMPPEMEDLARQFHAFERARKVKTVAELLRFVLLYAGLDHSLREVAANAVLVNPALEYLSEQSVRERLQACLPWLQALVPTLLTPPEAPDWPANVALHALDASDISAPGARQASWRIHLVLDVLRWRVVSMQMTEASTGETLLNFDFVAGTVVLADRGYSHRRGLAHLIDQGARPIVRLHSHHVPLADRTGAALDLAAVLRDCAPGETRTQEAQFTAPNGKTYPVFVHAYRLQGVAAEAARRRCRRAAQKAGKKKRYTPSQASLLLAEFVLVLTTVPPTELSAEAVLALYRCRWQIELVFKHFKSLLDFDAVRARHGSVLGQVWLQGKLLYAALLMRRAQRCAGADWQQLEQARDGTWWRVWKMAKQALAPLISLAACWHPADWPKALRVLKERRRRRQLQQVPPAVVTWLQQPA